MLQSFVRSQPLRASAAPASGAEFQTLAGEMLRARARTDHLFGLVPEPLLFERPIAERHRLLFYLGHLEAFDVNLLLPTSTTPRAADPLDRLFAFGIDPVDGTLPDDRPEDWPAPDDVRAYAQRTRARIDAWLAEPAQRSQSADAVTRLNAAVEHRWMHAETLAYLLNRLPLERTLRAVAASQRMLADDDMALIPAGRATLGHRAGADSGFGWDNEFPAHAVEVPAFRIDRHMVSNAQFLRFLDAGGYHERRYWSAQDWRWRESQNVQHPAAWVRAADQWLLMSRSDLIAFQGDWPVYVSHAEACAYTRWAGKRLPSEAEWQRAAYGGVDGEPRYPWGDAAPDSRRGNFDFESWDPVPVDAHPQGASRFGVIGLLGNGWEWTHTAFAPFAGFQPFAFYPGYSADFFDGRHFVLKGGSAHTALPLLRPGFRNWFQPHYPFPFAGFRCVTGP